MQNQNLPGNDPQAPQAGGYNDFYGANAAGGQPTMQANPTFGDNSAAANYDPNSFYNQPPASSFPNNDPSAAYAQDPNMGMSQTPLYDPNQAPMMADTTTQSTFEEPKSGNRFLVIGVVVLIVILLGVAGYIVYAYKDVLFGGGNTPTTETAQTTTTPKKDTSPANTSNPSTGNGLVTNTTSGSSDNFSCLVANPTKLIHSDPNETPAQKAKFYNETNVSCDWLKRSFAGKTGSVDQITGQCLKPEICGLTIDSDADGLTNIQEFNYQTDPLNSDTDGDKIADGDELNVYSTDPKRNDSDGDTFVDSQELANCYDPNINGKTLAPTDTTEGKLTISRQNEIKNKIVINPLHEPTISTLKATSDILALTNGFSKCTPTGLTAAPIPTPTSGSSTNSTSGTTTSGGSTTSGSTIVPKSN